MSITIQRPTVEVCDDGDAWDAFLVENGGTPMAVWGWGRAAGTYGFDPYFLVARAGETIVGGLPLVHLESRVFGDSLVSLPYTSQGELLVSDHDPEGVTRTLLAEARRLGDDLGVDVVTVRATDLGDRDDDHFVRDVQYVSPQVPLSDGVDGAWNGMKKTRRKQVEKATEKHGLEYVVGTSVDDLKAFYDLYLRSMRSHGSPPHSFAYVRTLWEELDAGGYGLLSLVEKDGEVINGAIEIAAGSRAVASVGASNYAYRDLYGGILLDWKGIEWAAERGCEVYDFGRTRPESGIHNYKQSFGTTDVDLVDYHYFPNDAFELSDAEDEKYDLAKRVWQKLPLVVTQAVGPQI